VTRRRAGPRANTYALVRIHELGMCIRPARKPGVCEPHFSPYHNKEKHTVKATPALSWADVAIKGQTRDRKEMVSPHSFYEIQIRQVFIRSLYEYS
jgi:hypothetical protein